MTKFSEALLDSMLALVRHEDDTADKVTAYEEVKKSGGYCKTCYYEYIEIEITYTTTEGDVKVFNYYGDFGELIRELTNE